jgi:hypothetical protein
MVLKEGRHRKRELKNKHALFTEDYKEKNGKRENF